MSFSPFLRFIFLLSCSAACNVALGQRTAVVNTTWLPVTEAERQASAPTVEKDAGAEALFWRVHVVDELFGSDLQRVFYHYVRLKIFSEEGQKAAATIDIEFGDKLSIIYIEGRTIKADGSVRNLDKNTIHDRDLIRAGGLKRKVKSFAMPGLEPGAIVEYRWKEILNDPRIMYVRLQFQREFPVRKVTYFVKPLSQEYTTFTMGAWPFNCKPSPLQLEPDGFNSTFLENVPAFKEEPMMPSEPNVRPWMLVYYRKDMNRNQEKYWQSIGKEAYRELKLSLKLNNEMKIAAVKAVDGAQDDEAKILQLIRYVRSNFRGLFDPSVTEAERGKILREMPRNRYRTSVEVFKSGIGTADELNTLFAALASEVGLDARPAFVATRSDLFFHERLAERYFLPNIDMAVKSGNFWKVFDVSARLLPPGLLHWSEEGIRALVADPKAPVFITTPISPPEASVYRRNAKLDLAEDGSLQGEVQEIYTGHAAAIPREDFEGESEQRQQEEVKERLQRIHAQAEVTAVSIQNATDPEKPLEIRYHVRIPNYAARTGTRLLIQPLFFQRGSAPLFTAGERKYDIHFRHAWKEVDRVTIAVPDGYVLDNASNPGNLDFGVAGSYSAEIKTLDNALICERDFVFGKQGAFVFTKEAYGQLKAVFDEIHRRDSHSISLRRRNP